MLRFFRSGPRVGRSLLCAVGSGSFIGESCTFGSLFPDNQWAQRLGRIGILEKVLEGVASEGLLELGERIIHAPME